MKKIVITLLLFVAAQGLRAQEVHQKYIQKSPNKIVVNATNGQTLIAEIEQGKAYLIDVRTADEFKLSHLANAQNIDIRGNDFGPQIAKLDKGKTVYIYCHSGNRAGKATDSLLVLGFKSPYNIGGLDSLKKAGFPVGK